MKKPGSDAAIIPDKVYFKIGEVSDLVGVDAHVLRYWESEFRQVRPQRARSNQRLYRQQDVQFLLRIRQLLHEEGYTIEGARRRLTRELAARRDEGQVREPNVCLADIRSELEEIRKLLDGA
ncbi:MAG: hypothetical protein BWK76_04980 [Desulfobulbaceae bacterium A2]|nr:MAG: hypothetical protein BWK76_04980 [Desulfobulbaceae bacterium A2]